MHSDNSRLRSTLAVASLAFGAFSSVTTEFIPVGVLPDVAQSFGVSSGQAGLMMTLPGMLGAIAAPGVLMAAGRLDRKWLLTALSALLFLSAITSAFAQSWFVMLVSRGLAGVSLGAFWAMGLAVAGSLVSAEKAGAAIAAVFGGVTLAMILGVPLGAMVAEHFTWRGAFIAAALMAALAFLLQLVFLPPVAAESSMGPRQLFNFISKPAGKKSLVLIGLIYGTHFGTYTYVAPLMREPGITPAVISWALLGFGLTGFLANFIASRFVAQLRLTLTAALILFSISLLVLATSWSVWILIAAVLTWGAAWGAAPLCLNIANRSASGEEIEAGSAMFTFTAQVSIAAGSALGGVMVDAFGVRADFLTGGGLLVLSILLLWVWKTRSTENYSPERAVICNSEK